MEMSESTEAIRRKIISDSEKKAQELIEEAKDKAADILDSARKRAEEMKMSELEQIKKLVEDKSVQDLAEKKVAHHRRLQSYKSQTIDDVFDRVKDELQQYVKKPAYIETLRKLIVESGVALGGGRLSVTVNETDRKKMKKDLVKKLPKTIQDKANNKTEMILDEKSSRTIGGAVVSAVDQQASIDNTFEARLERVKEAAKAELEAILFK